MSCAAKFEKDVAAIPGVTRAELNFPASKITVLGQISSTEVSKVGKNHDIIAVLEGNQATQEMPNSWQKYQALISGGTSGLTLLIGWILKLAGASPTLIIACFSLSIVMGGFPTARKAFFGLKKLEFDMNVLMTIAVIGAVLIGEWSEAAAVCFLFSVSNTLEAYTMEKARRSIRDLMDLTPKEALVRRNGKETILTVEEIVVGDILIIKPGEKIAMDGTVINGRSTVNQAAITGESIPVEKNGGDEVFAGTLNYEGSLEVLVTKLAHDTTIAKIIHLVEEAQAQKAPSQKFIDRFAAIYTPIVLFLAAAIVTIPPVLFGSAWTPWIYRGLTLLVVSCPCALVVSTPVALVSAIGSAARRGVLIKGGAYLEAAASLSAIAFDKTGTLTTGNPSVTDVIPLGTQNEESILALAASIERLSEHPLAKAITAAALQKHLHVSEVAEFASFTGRGATAVINGQKYIIGSLKFMSESGLAITPVEAITSRLHSEGKTAVILAGGSELLGLIALADKLRPDSRQAVEKLNNLGMTTVMLTGDNCATAVAIAHEAGINEFKAELLPENKVAAVKDLLELQGKVAMVGDGINDAPALATATLGIAMGAVGTDTALETADIALMADDLSGLPFLIRLSKACLKVIKQNVWFSVLIKLIAILLVFPGWLNLWLAILADMGTTILVTLNGIRLHRVKSY